MNSICRDIFQAIHEGKWIQIEYKNKQGNTTKYWIGIRNLDVRKRTLSVEGLHLGRCTVAKFDTIFIDSILSSHIIDGSYCEINQELIKDIHLNPHKYKTLFDHVANLKILNYLELCNKLDTVPYNSIFDLVSYLDNENIQISHNKKGYRLSDEQFRKIVKTLQFKIENIKETDTRVRELGMNVLSIHTNKGLYVLAYKKLYLDIKLRCLRPEKDVSICTEFAIDGVQQSVRRFLDAEEFELLSDFEANQEKIKDAITSHNTHCVVDDMPYIIGLGKNPALDLHSEYKAIIEMFDKGKITVPIKAFFGELLERPRRRKAYPMALLNTNINLDQLLAINNGMKYPLAYIQGPPGTGKTNTIINTIITAFFNDKTVLFSSYNNHPINGVMDKLTGMKYRGRTIPFPILRIGNREKTIESIQHIRALYEMTTQITIFEETLDRNKDDRTVRARDLAILLRKYEEHLDLQERKETINRVVEYEEKRNFAMQMLPFHADLTGRQMNQVNRKMEKVGQITEEEARRYLDTNVDELLKYLYYISAKYIKRLSEQKYAELIAILYLEDTQLMYEEFMRYIDKTENIKKLQKVFPIMASTCISAHRIGKPEPVFDMIIMDEASQCNIAVSLVPIIRGENLMLVGDPQQLNPVIVLDDTVNHTLRKKYGITEEYDYKKNSIYKTYLACDAVSDEILLRNHYRCAKKIIEFNNKKYYNSKLHVLTQNKSENVKPLIYINVSDSESYEKNTAPAEVEQIIAYAKAHPDKSIGVITPFVNQKKLIEWEFEKNQIHNITCGTVHAFQGDEKDVILFSTAITDSTYKGTYDWLKNNKELINVATSRAKEQLIVLSNSKNLKRLHTDETDDLYELIRYVATNGTSVVTPKVANSRALGIKPFSSKTEEAFLQNLTHALGNIWLSESKFLVHKEVPISQVFADNINYSDLFYTGRFDFVVYERHNKVEIPVLAIELDGKEHFEDEVVKIRDQKKNEICRRHHLEIIRVENAYARRYNHIKDILMKYFEVKNR